MAGEGTENQSPSLWKGGVQGSSVLPGRLSCREVPTTHRAFSSPLRNFCRESSAVSWESIRPQTSGAVDPLSFLYHSPTRLIPSSKQECDGSSVNAVVFQAIFPNLISTSSLDKSKYSIGFRDEEAGAKRLTDLQGVTPAKK